MFNLKSACNAVIGIGFGDEGKGMVVNSLCSHYDGFPLVVRYSGGQQAGHKAVTDDKEHIFSNFGSGTLQGCPTYWSKFCTFDPIASTNELKILKEKEESPFLFLDSKCPVTTPYDIMHNRLDYENKQHGTCGSGVGRTFQREDDHYSLLAEDIYFESILEKKLKLIRQYYWYLYGEKDCNLTELHSLFLERCALIRNYGKYFLVDGMPYADEIVFEGSQGLMLDPSIGFFPHVTRSNTGTKNIVKMGYEPHLYLVTRAYQTRHGNGPMAEEFDIQDYIDINPWETNSSDHKYQGEFRRTFLDLNFLEYAIEKDELIFSSSKKTLIVSCLDLCKNKYVYVLDGKKYFFDSRKEFLSGIEKYLEIEVLPVDSPKGF